MRYTRIPALAAAALAAFPALAQEVAFEKYKLANGMTVILHEDHSLPVAGINTWFRVGSKDEPPGRSGFAHLFEHLMFMGTQRVPGSQFDVLMETGGGSNNASTSFDRTNYFSNGPASLLPTLLWLDADRLEDLGRTMDQQKLDKQRDIVRNERRQSIENQPYGKAELVITEIMFPAGHPYHFEVIGTHTDLEAAGVQDVKDFFGTFYVPNNASLVVAGDFKSAEIKPLVEQLFGSIVRGATPMHMAAAPVKLGRVVRSVALDQVQLPRIAMCYHSPAAFADGDAEMDLLAAVLSQGKSSRLYKRLVLTDKIAVDVGSFQSSAALQSVFRIDITPAPGADLDRVEAVVDEEVARLLKDGVTGEELEQRKATIELSKLSALQSAARKADKLNEYEFFWGNPDGFKRDLDRYRNATPKQVHDWAKKVVTQDSRLIMRVLPDQPERAESGRDQRPMDFPTTNFVPQKPEEFTLSNGMKAMLWSKRELPLVSVRVLFTPGGPLDDGRHAGRSGLTAQMLEEGAGQYTAEQFGDVMQGLGASYFAGASTESAAVGLTVVKRNLTKALELMKLSLRQPTMKEEDWERVKRLHLEALKQEDDQPLVVAGRVGQRVLYGESSPYGWPTSGTKETVAGLTLADIKTQHAALFSPGHATVLIGGDLTRAEAETLLNGVFADWKGGTKRADVAAVEAPSHDGLRVVLVDRPGSVQTVVRFIAPGIRRKDDRRVAYQALNTILGASFTSRLNANLREEHGYTYGAGSRFSLLPGTGYWVARASVKADTTGASVTEFMKEFDRIRAGDVSPDELRKAVETMRTEFAQSFEGVGGPVGQGADVVEAGLGFETLAADVAAAGRLTAEELNAAARAALPIERGVLVLMGDKALIMEQIKGLKLPAPVEYGIDGKPVK